VNPPRLSRGGIAGADVGHDGRSGLGSRGAGHWSVTEPAAQPDDGPRRDWPGPPLPRAGGRLLGARAASAHWSCTPRTPPTRPSRPWRPSSGSPVYWREREQQLNLRREHLSYRVEAARDRPESSPTESRRRSPSTSEPISPHSPTPRGAPGLPPAKPVATLPGLPRSGLAGGGSATFVGWRSSLAPVATAPASRPRPVATVP
jgi:hypothetical protein